MAGQWLNMGSWHVTQEGIEPASADPTESTPLYPIRAGRVRQDPLRHSPQRRGGADAPTKAATTPTRFFARCWKADICQMAGIGSWHKPSDCRSARRLVLHLELPGLGIQIIQGLMSLSVAGLLIAAPAAQKPDRRQADRRRFRRSWNFGFFGSRPKFCNSCKACHVLSQGLRTEPGKRELFRTWRPRKTQVTSSLTGMTTWLVNPKIGCGEARRLPCRIL